MLREHNNNVTWRNQLQRSHIDVLLAVYQYLQSDGMYTDIKEAIFCNILRASSKLDFRAGRLLRLTLKISHHALRFAECHVRLDNFQHVRGDFIHVLQGPDAERYNRSVVLRQEDKEPKHTQSFCHWKHRGTSWVRLLQKDLLIPQYVYFSETKQKLCWLVSNGTSTFQTNGRSSYMCYKSE